MRILVLWPLLAVTLAAQAQTPADSLREYDLDELVVSTSYSTGTFETVKTLGLADLAQLVPTTAESAISYLPSARVQTNSRGEALVYLRNSGERQVAVFLDGAPLNIAWDNRVDLALVPSGAIGRLSLISGPSSVLLGTNVSGGAVELISRLPTSGRMIELDGSLGSMGFAHAAIRYFGSVAGWRIGSILEYGERQAVPIAANASLPFSQVDEDRRTNTDWQLTNLHLRAQRDFGDRLQVGFTLLGNSGAKGVAPESHLDPSIGSVRYWRYPDTKRVMAIVSSTYRTNRTLTTASVWAQRFGQRIDQYETAAYSNLTYIQTDVDISAGARVVTEVAHKSDVVRILASYAANNHDQTDLADGVEATNEYRQDVYSIGAEYETSRSRATTFRFGSSFDGYHAPGTPITGLSGTDYSLSVGANRKLNETTSLRMGGARKVRFPTARESQDTGLGRFLLNPDLSPETSYLAELGVEGTAAGWTYSIIPFAQRTIDTIDQTRVLVDSVSYRQRINLDGSRVIGVEVVGGTAVTSRMRLSGSLTWMRARGLVDGGTTRLTERPNMLANASVSYRVGSGLVASSELRYSGEAWGQDESGDLVSLAPAALLDLRIAQSAYFSRVGVGFQGYVRVENVFDSVSIPQLGLPGGGRFIRLGMSLVI